MPESSSELGSEKNFPATRNVANTASTPPRKAKTGRAAVKVFPLPVIASVAPNPAPAAAPNK